MSDGIPTPKIREINSILIANRGEIASRIIRTCRKMGIRSIAVFSKADKNALYVGEADTAIFIGESNASESYLNQDRIIAAAKNSHADAIHPGYGFLSENVTFAKRCAAEQLIFIGPNPAAIVAMGSKSAAKILMKKHGVPVVPGYEGKDQSPKTLRAAAIEIGFPVLLKATAGGGGKGMRIVHEVKGIEQAIEAAQREAQSAFGNAEMIVEKYIPSARHIEFQIFGDQHGNVIHVLERECTIQRRYQKVIEESPSPVLTEELRKIMGAAAVNAAQALSYDNAGTVEFIYDEKSGEFYFLEVNTRLQVEHPVTEEITGLDLVQMQIESAQDLPLSIFQQEIHGNGYAVECRLYAEDAANNFLPVTGKIHRFEIPEVEGLRVETAIRSGSEISIYYDPMIAKLIVWDKNRAGALRKMQYVLRNLVCLGTTTNQDFLLYVLQNQDFKNGNYDTHFIQNKIDLKVFDKKNLADEVFSNNAITFPAIASTLVAWKKREERRTFLKSVPSGWRNSFYEFQQDIYIFGEKEILVKYRFQKEEFLVKVNKKEYAVQLITADEKSIRVNIDGAQFQFQVVQQGNDFYLHNEQLGNMHLVSKERFPAKAIEKIKGGYIAPMPSQIIKILVAEGQTVKSGEGLIVLSSMKMENTISAAEDGTVAEIFAKESENVEAGFLLLKIS